MSQKSGFLIVSNGFFIENVGHTLTKNYNGTYWPLKSFPLYHFKAAYVVLHITVKEFFRSHF